MDTRYVKRSPLQLSKAEAYYLHVYDSDEGVTEFIQNIQAGYKNGSRIIVNWNVF